MYEAPLLRNITSRAGPLTLTSGAEVRARLNLSRPSFVDFTILLGTDFSQRLKGLGPHRAIDLIRTHLSIECLLRHQPKYTPEPRASHDAYLAQVAVARIVFETLPPVPSVEALAPKRGAYDPEALADVLDLYGLTRLVADNTYDGSVLQNDFFEGTGQQGFDSGASGNWVNMFDDDPSIHTPP